MSENVYTSNTSNQQVTMSNVFYAYFMTVGYTGPLTPTVGVTGPIEGK